jgi:hypothetical protein
MSRPATYQRYPVNATSDQVVVIPLVDTIHQVLVWQWLLYQYLVSGFGILLAIGQMSLKLRSGLITSAIYRPLAVRVLPLHHCTVYSEVLT